MSQLNLWVLNKIEGYCLEQIKNSKKFPLGTKEELLRKETRQYMAEKILNIIQENKK